MKTCSSCNKNVVDNFVEFPCPGNLKVKIVRCSHCRESVKAYQCETDNGMFVGP